MAKKGKFEYWESESEEEWYFRLVNEDDEVLFQSEGYETDDECIEGIDKVKKCVKTAETELIDEPEEYDDDGDDDDDDDDKDG